MSTSVDANELLNLLESTDPDVVAEIKTLILGNLQNSREAWLLNALVDSYSVSHSEKCLEIIASISEPHDKHLFDKLLEYIKGNSKLQALTILGYIIRKQPPWLHKIVQHSLLSTTIKCLKNITDVPILMSGLLVITSLLPIIPISAGAYLTEIFDVFSRLSAFNFKKPGNVPDVYLVHLQVGIYSLFHRLYGMYPCHFLTYLRATYSKNENAQIFEKTIKPMLQRVRMHPLLVTASKDKEISRDRWKQMEVHDIIVDCAKLSLDLTEGSSEEKRCPITGSKQHLPGGPGFLQATVHETTAVTVTKSRTVTSTQSIITNGLSAGTNASAVYGLVEMDDSGVPWSPAASCGISTPPPVPVTSSLKVEIPSSSVIQPAGPQTTHSGNPPQTPQRMTPHTRVPDSPLPTQQAEQEKSANTSSERHAKLQKRLSGFSLSLAGKLPTPTEGESGSVPPSPLKPDFTSEPPLHVQKMQAIRKLSFQTHDDRFPRDDDDDDIDHIKVKKLADPPRGKNAPVEQSGEKQPQASVSVEGLTPGTSASDPVAHKLDMPSLTQLPNLIDNLDHEDTGTINEEVMALISGDVELHGDTSSEGSDTPTHLPQSTDLTAQSVANFMKNVNRIRFNSINVVKNPRVIEKPVKTSRSRSCPSLENELSDIEDGGSRERSGSMQSGEREVSSESTLQTSPTDGVTSAAPVAAVSSRETASIGSQTSFYLTAGGPETEENEELVESRIAFPYEQMYPMSLPFAPFIQCYYCMTRHKETCPGERFSQSSEHKSVLGEKCSPFYTGFSPPDLLDRHLASGMAVHSKELSQIPLTSHGAVTWTHFGGASKSGSGIPPADEVAILRGQIVMLHNQLMFERHKREIHAKRNRRLLGSIAKYASLEEQNSAMKDQARLMENEIESLKSSLLEQQKKFQEMKTSEMTSKYEQESQLRTCRLDVETLKELNTELTEKISALNEENEHLNQELQADKVKIFNLESDIQACRIKSELAQGLQQQVGRLNKELLLMGELQQKYQQRLSVSGNTQTGKPELQFRLESYKMELKNMKQNFDLKTTQLDGVKARMKELEESVKSKDLIILDQKRSLEDARELFKFQLQAVEEKYLAQKKVQQSLQTEMLDLFHQIGRKTTPIKPSKPETPPSTQRQDRRGSSTRDLQHGASAATGRLPRTFPTVDSALDIVAMAADSDSSDPLRTPESEAGGSM